MKKYLLSLMLGLTCLWGSGQSFQLEVKYPDTASFLMPRNLSLFDDDRFGLLHTSLSSTAINSSVSMHTVEGAPEWCKRIKLDGDAQIGTGKVLATSDGGLLLGVDVENEGVGVIKLDMLGSLEWSFLFPGLTYVNALDDTDNILLLETTTGYGIGLVNILFGQDNFAFLNLNHQGTLQAGYRLFVENFNTLANVSFDHHEQQVVLSASAYEGVSSNYTATGTIRLSFDLESGVAGASHRYSVGYPIRDIVQDETGNQYCLFEETSSGRNMLVKYQPDGAIGWSKLTSPHSFDFITSYDVGLSLSANAINIHYSLGNTPPFGGINRIRQEDGAPIWGKVQRYWHNSNFGQPTALPTTDDGLIGGVFWGGTGRYILYRTKPDGSLPACEPINRCDLMMPTISPPPAQPLAVQTEPYHQQEPLPLALIEQPLLVTPFCEQLQQPVADFTVLSSACPGEVVSAGAIPLEVPAFSEWYAAGALIESSTSDSVTFQFPESGTYQIRHIRTAFECRDTFIQQILIEEGPYFELGADTMLCTGDSLFLESGLSPTEFELNWQNGSNESFLWISEADGYQLTATSTSGCSYTDNIIINEASTPQVDLGPDTALCQGATGILTPPVDIESVELSWSTGSNAPQLLISEPGLYAITATDIVSGCTSEDSIQIRSQLLPPFSYTQDTVFCPGRTLILEARSISTGLSFIWPDGAAGVQYKVDSTGDILLIATDGVCTDTVSIEITEGDCRVSAFVPDAFSPNGDGRNDRLQAFGPDIEVRSLRIFSRWGGMLFEAIGPDASWDGTVEGKIAGTGSYVYIVEYLNTLSLEKEQLSGVVNLIR
jgi:gliding motility-associated-like protein